MREGMPGRGEGRRGVGELPAPLFICFLSGLPLPAPPLRVALSKMLKGAEVAGVCLCGLGKQEAPSRPASRTEQ